jgi:diguanylate cyclase (GGDEF)-like protein
MGYAASLGILRLTAELCQLAERGDEPATLALTAKRLARRVGAARSAALPPTPGEGFPAEPQVAQDAGTIPFQSGRGTFDLPLPVRGRSGWFGTVVLYEVPGDHSEARIDVCREVVAQVARAIEAARVRSELDHRRQQLAELRTAHDCELENHARRLRQLNELKDGVLSVCAHDLRTPLHVILSHAALLSEGVSGPVTEAQRNQLEVIARQGRRMSGLIEELLHARRAGIDTLEVQVREGDVARLLEECAAEMRVPAGEKAITLTAELPSLPRVQLDDSKIRQVVVNLLANALKFTPVGGTISIGARPRDTDVELWISDSGPGVPADEVDTIFERFRRGRAGEQLPSGGGVGLGLAICKEIVVRHGGDIWVEECPGGGASFRFTLRVAPPRPAAAQAELTQKPVRRVLLCEDDPQHADVVSMVLSERGLRVELAKDGQEGLERARASCPDLVLLDVQLPKVDGFTVAERLQRDARTRDIPILFLSACEGVDARVRALQLGAADFLAKPFYAAELVARVERTLDLVDQRRRLLALANEDELTGIGNYRYLRERLHAEHARALRYRTQLALAIVKVQGVEDISDRLGREAGASTLRRVGQALRKVARETDTVARYLGADFIVLLPHAGRDEARRFVDRVRNELGSLQACFGVAELPMGAGGTGGSPPEQLLRAAEEALGADRRRSLG